MSKEPSPILHISGILSEKDYKKAVRASGLRRFWIYMVIYLLMMVLIPMIVTFKDLYPWLRDGYIPFDAFLERIFRSVIDRGAWIIAVGFIAFYALYQLWFRPVRAGKQMRELDPEGAPLVYDFYEDMLVTHIDSRSGENTVRMHYTDVQRKIKETKYVFTLSTGQKNRTGLFKAIMTPEEEKNVRELLKERCPQRRRRS
ncbi:MAG: hypothetical protein IK140_05340 [Clostridia bacterium]|nr:hypothetical protein [Clostridia bacterium]